MERYFIVLGSGFGALAVALGAFGAHSLQGRIGSDLLETFEIGVRYHFYHALALFVAAMVVARWPNSLLPVIAGWLFVLGILVFSGSLYVLALTGVRWLGAVTPIGGVAFIVAWLCLAVAAWRG